MIICANTSGFSHADAVKMGYRGSEYLKWETNSKHANGYVSPYIGMADGITGILVIESRRNKIFDEDDALPKISRYHIWYNKRNEDNYLSDVDKLVSGNQRSKTDFELREAMGSLAGTVTFFGADYALTRTADKLGENKSLKKNLSTQSREFLYQNGKMVLASAAGYTTRVVCTEGFNGLNSYNATQFGKCAAIQVGADFTEQYVVDPLVNYCMGQEKSIGKEGFKFALMAAPLIVFTLMKS